MGENDTYNQEKSDKNKGVRLFGKKWSFFPMDLGHSSVPYSSSTDIDFLRVSWASFIFVGSICSASAWRKYYKERSVFKTHIQTWMSSVDWKNFKPKGTHTKHFQCLIFVIKSSEILLFVVNIFCMLKFRGWHPPHNNLDSEIFPIYNIQCMCSK